MPAPKWLCLSNHSIVVLLTAFFSHISWSPEFYLLLSWIFSSTIWSCDWANLWTQIGHFDSLNLLTPWTSRPLLYLLTLWTCQLVWLAVQNQHHSLCFFFSFSLKFALHASALFFLSKNPFHISVYFQLLKVWCVLLNMRFSCLKAFRDFPDIIFYLCISSTIVTPFPFFTTAII